MSTTFAYARRYRAHGLATIHLAPGLKYPDYPWKDALDEPEHWIKHPKDGIAIRLALSGLVALDVDDIPRTERVLQDHRGVSLSELRATMPCVIGRNFQLLFRAPDVPLKHRSITWPKEDNPRASFVLFEFRAGNITSTVAPTIHPGTGQPYRWENPPRNGFPPLPARLLDLWLDWEETARRARALCPWAPEPKPIAERQASRRDYVGPSIIKQFNALHDVLAILASHGYRRDGKRFAAPDCKHAAGITLLPSGKIFCHHQGDPLRSEHALDCFDVFRVLDHGGDYRAAVRAAAVALGLDRERAA